ncbi:hypothetical protein BJ322DRAFT_243295 [Thelephora terrestris]|uniref:Uncharacterized protein n=1 Tax=Thelephora terrestris TaxID=56493 RepID=A0A9P6H9A7_9AGAM|nr:hypothetical protein BJ322DRAFT_243295 [Thelephora terrestris]
MTFHSTQSSPSIFQDGRLKPGIYKIRNVLTQTFVDIEEHSRMVCSRPLQSLEEGNGLWEIKPLAAGYSVKRVEPGKPDQFCTVVWDGSTQSALSVSAYPVAWGIEIVDDPKHRGFEYIRLCWGSTVWGWIVRWRSKDNGETVHIWTTDQDRESEPLMMWKLIPVETTDQAVPPSYEGDGAGVGQSSVHAQRSESESDDFGTIVTEVSTVTTTTTTRRRYRVEDT